MVPLQFPVPTEMNVNSWKVSWSGLCDRRAVEATLLEAGGWFEQGDWYVPAKYRYPVYICRRLAEHFYCGVYLITLNARLSPLAASRSVGSLTRPSRGRTACVSWPTARLRPRRR